MFYKGASLGKITQHVAQFYGAKISHVTILKWVRKFSELIDNYANTLRPQLSGVWNCDEMKTKMAHEEPINGERFYWLWNAFDNGSRYLIASHLTRGRGHKDAREFFKVAKKQAKKDPRVIFSDGLDSYRGEYRPSSNAPVVHIANVGIRSHMGNHRVERLHNSIREREKVMRHLKKAKSAEKVFKGYRAYYNYVRPHMALENHTPAEMAAIPIQLGTNRWLDNQTSSETHQGGELSNQALEEG
jgi:transposase-like protein